MRLICRNLLCSTSLQSHCIRPTSVLSIWPALVCLCFSFRRLFAKKAENSFSNQSPCFESNVTGFFSYQIVGKYPAACVIYSFKHTKPNVPNDCFSVFLSFHLLLEMVSCGKQNIILVCFSETDVNVRNNWEEYIIFHAFCWELLEGFYLEGFIHRSV